MRIWHARQHKLACFHDIDLNVLLVVGVCIRIFLLRKHTADEFLNRRTDDHDFELVSLSPVAFVGAPGWYVFLDRLLFSCILISFDKQVQIISLHSEL